MSKRLDLARLKGGLVGGATSAVLTVPVSMGYGVLALLPLGDQYIPVGILAGLGQREGLGPIIGAISATLPEPSYLLGFVSILIPLQSLPPSL